MLTRFIAKELREDEYAANGTAAGCSVGFANLLPHKKLRIPSSTYTCTRP